jgi:hypothetical protein
VASSTPAPARCGTAVAGIPRQFSWTPAAGGGCSRRRAHCLWWSPTLDRPEAQVVLPAGSTLLLYTDGLVERRGEAIDEGIVRTVEVLTQGRHLTPADLSGLLTERLLGDAPDDDVAFLLYRRPSGAEFDSCGFDSCGLRGEVRPAGDRAHCGSDPTTSGQ